MKRKLDPEILRAMEASVKGIADFELAVANKLWRPAVTLAATPWEGVKELSNSNDGEYISLTGLTVDRKHTGEAYCLAWVQTILAFVEYKLGIESALKATEGCLDLWNSTPPAMKTTRYPLPGYIAIWQHGQTPAGHAGIVISVKDAYFKTIEANSYGPDGKTQGIFYQERLFNDSSNMKLKGFISPF